MTAQVAKIFMNGSSQAVRLPKEYRFSTDKIYITKQGSKVILSEKRLTWDDFFNTVSAFDSSFLQDRMDHAPQEREF